MIHRWLGRERFLRLQGDNSVCGKCDKKNDGNCGELAVAVREPLAAVEISVAVETHLYLWRDIDRCRDKRMAIKRHRYL